MTLRDGVHILAPNEGLCDHTASLSHAPTLEHCLSGMDDWPALAWESRTPKRGGERQA